MKIKQRKSTVQSRRYGRALGDLRGGL